MVVVGEGHSLQISTRTLSNAWSLTAVCWCVLGGRGGGAASFWFVLGGRGGGVSSWFVLGGRGGGASLSLCCGSLLSGTLGNWSVSSAKKCCGGIGGGGESSLFSSSLGESWVSSAKNCFGRIGGGGEPSVSTGLWERDVVSTLLERVPGRIIIDLSEHTQAY